MRETHYIYGIHIHDRVRDAPDVQKIFTKYGCNIKTRIGLHEAHDNICSPGGVILLEMVGNEEVFRGLKEALQAIDGVDVKEMVFTH